MSARAAARIPARSGIGLRAAHYRDLLESRPAVGWLEVHSENYFGEGGAPLHYLELARASYPLSLHGVGMSLGSTDSLDYRHLARLRALIERFEPGLVSDHLSWSSVGGRHFNDLLPLPYTEEALAHVSRRVLQVQEYLHRRLLVENPSTYLQHAESCIPEWEFLAELARRTGCGILLDVNNVYVSARNHRLDARRFIDSLPGRHVAEIHLAGFASSNEVLIDTHSRPVAAEVWALFARAVERFGPRPALIEWDADLPPLALLLAEAGHAQALLEGPCPCCVRRSSRSPAGCSAPDTPCRRASRSTATTFSSASPARSPTYIRSCGAWWGRNSSLSSRAAT